MSHRHFLRGLVAVCISAASIALAGKPSVLWQVTAPGHFPGQVAVAGGEVITAGYTNGPDCISVRRVSVPSGALRSTSRCPAGETISSMLLAATPRGDAITAALQSVPAAPGTSGLVVTKHDRDSGAVIWERRFTAAPAVLAIVTDARGDVLLSLGVSLQGRIVKLSGADGAVLWEDVWETTSVPTIRADSAGNVFIASAGYGDGAVRKYSPEGAVLWTRRIGDGSSSMFPKDLQIDSSGNAVVTGGMATVPGRFDRAFTTMKLAAGDGATLWSHAMDLVDRDDVGLSVAITADGETVATGHSDGMMTTLRYSAGGQLVSKAVHPRAAGSSDDRGFTVRGLPGGDAVVSGWVRRGGVQDVRVVRYSRDGTPVWSTPYRYSRYDREFPVDLVAAPDGAILVSTSSGGQSATAGASFVKLSLAARPGNHQGLWWRAPAGSAPGWGLNLAHQGDVIFGAWFTYGLDMQPDWYFMPAMENISLDEYEGDVYHATGPAFDSQTFDSSQVRLGNYGPARLEFASDGAARFRLLNETAPPAESVVPYVFGTTQSTCDSGVRAPASQNFQDLWWADPPGSQSGWGVFLTHQGDSIFLTWFTYAAGGKATWYFASDVRKTGTRAYRGALYRASGATFRSDPWPEVRTTQVGETFLEFDDADHGLFRYSVDGVTGSKRITRNAFAVPATVCQ